MKRIALLLCLVLSATFGQAQTVGLDDIWKLTFYGVDFSLARVYGATETPLEFRNAFDGINTLFQTEAKKYDVSKTFGKNKDVTVSLSMMRERNDGINLSLLMIDQNKYDIPDNMIATQVSLYDTGNEPGYGAVLIAGLIDKSKKQATYHQVVFDNATKEIIFHRQVTTKAGGLGLRNYWASSVHKALARIK